LQKNQKQQTAEDCLPEARRRISEPPYPIRAIRVKDFVPWRLGSLISWGVHPIVRAGQKRQCISDNIMKTPVFIRFNSNPQKTP
jgi:hypothetical protein